MITRLGRRKSPATTLLSPNGYRQPARVPLIWRVASMTLTFSWTLLTKFLKHFKAFRQNVFRQNFEVGPPVFQKRLST